MPQQTRGSADVARRHSPGALIDRLARPHPLLFGADALCPLLRLPNAESASLRRPASKWCQPRLLFSETSQRRVRSSGAASARSIACAAHSLDRVSSAMASMCSASIWRNSRPADSAIVAAVSNSGTASAGRPPLFSRRPLSSAMRVLTTASAGSPKDSSNTCPSSKRCCRPSARARWVTSSARSDSVYDATASSTANRRSDAAGSPKSHSSSRSF